ncbi:MAG: hypothetical protein ABJO52_20890 [Nisaea sp.]|uniref:hypothetical protein n=1 Tax=Nisaea sp. TaxID=2024842 RepID=UPI003296DCA4
MDDPKETRLVQTRDGVARIPREQQGVPIREFFRNSELPNDLERAQVFQSETGPVLANPDPVPWTEIQDKEAQTYAENIKSQIDEKGYYSKSLSHYADRLSDATGYSKDEMKAMIVSKFDATYEQDPFDYLQGVRAEKGLPVRERTAQPEQNQEPEM